MNKQLIQDVIKAGNKAMDVVHIKYTVDTKDNRYYSYDEFIEIYNELYDGEQACFDDKNRVIIA